MVGGFTFRHSAWRRWRRSPLSVPQATACSVHLRSLFPSFPKLSCELPATNQGGIWGKWLSRHSGHLYQTVIFFFSFSYHEWIWENCRRDTWRFPEFSEWHCWTEPPGPTFTTETSQSPACLLLLLYRPCEHGITTIKEFIFLTIVGRKLSWSDYEWGWF